MTLPPNFNRLARVYQGLEVVSFGPFLRLCRCAFLPALNSSRRALVLGDGDGRFTARLLRACPNLTIDAVDASSAMLQSLLRRAGPHAPRLRTFLADIRRFQPPNPPYDLIVTHFFLDCLTTAEVQRPRRNPAHRGRAPCPMAGLGVRRPSRRVRPHRGRPARPRPLLGLRPPHWTHRARPSRSPRCPPTIRLHASRAALSPRRPPRQPDVAGQHA